ncbi:hypothetical protein [Roseibium litorale]|nr:hypothetical protein [Roseibium litorale]
MVPIRMTPSRMAPGPRIVRSPASRFKRRGGANGCAGALPGHA